MSNPSATLVELKQTLQSVIEALIDSQKCFKKTGEEMEEPTLKLNFLNESLQRAEFRGDIESILHQEGEHDIKERGTITADLQRGWGSLRAALGGGDQALVDTADLSEHTTIQVYANATHDDLPYPVRQILDAQVAHIQLFHNYLKYLCAINR